MPSEPVVINYIYPVLSNLTNIKLDQPRVKSNIDQSFNYPIFLMQCKHCRCYTGAMRVFALSSYVRVPELANISQKIYQ